MKKTSIEKMLRREIVQLRRQKERIERRLNTLEKVLPELEVSGALNKATAATFGRKMGTNQLAIASILKDGNGPMAIREIANRAFQTGRIKSANGHRGIYAIVQTALRRNAATTFIKTAPGTWDLREKHSRGQEKSLKLVRER
jgi:hypothetical protein